MIHYVVFIWEPNSEQARPVACCLCADDADTLVALLNGWKKDVHAEWPLGGDPPQQAYSGMSVWRTAVPLWSIKNPAP